MIRPAAMIIDGSGLDAGRHRGKPTDTMNIPWSPASWQSKPLAQPIVYPDPEALRAVLGTLARLPPLVTSWEVESLKSQLAEASRGERFLLQGGDCSESFDDCQSAIIANKLKILLKMSFVLVYGCQKAVIRVGRFAGQYAKPRSAETRNHRWRDLAHLSRLAGQSPRLQPGRPHPEPRLPARRLPSGGADDQLHSRAGRRRACRPAPPRVVEPRFRQPCRTIERLPADRRRHQHRHPFHGDRGRPAAGRADAGRFLHQPRGLAPGLRAGPDPPGAAAAEQVVQPEHPFPLDRRSHAAAGRRPRGIFPRHRQPDRGEGRAVDDTR